MARGAIIGTKEKAYIKKWAYRLSWNHLAMKLVELYPDENGGHRDGGSIKNFVCRTKLVQKP